LRLRLLSMRPGVRSQFYLLTTARGQDITDAGSYFPLMVDICSHPHDMVALKNRVLEGTEYTYT